MPTITAGFAGRRHARDEVLQWEDRRVDRAARKLRVVAPPAGDVTTRREALLRTKLELGPEEILRRLSRDVRLADLAARTQARVSRRRRRSVVDLHVDAGRAEEFVTFFERAASSSEDPTMLRACPDHFVLRHGPRGQEVLETTGSSPFASLFVIDYDDVSSLTTPPDPVFPHHVAGVARASDGSPIGGVRHQFRDTGRGFHGRLTVELPLPTLPTMVAGHRWHLACEFSNWVEDYLSQ